VTIKIDNKQVKNYLYTAREADALLKGGVQQIYLGNLKVGKHELVAFFHRQGTGGARLQTRRDDHLRQGCRLPSIWSSRSPTVLAKHQPEFTIKDWE